MTNLFETFTVSHSGLNEFEKSPSNFLRYKLKERDTDSKAFSTGTAYHSFFLQNELFLYDYMVINQTPSAELSKLLQQIANGVEFDEAFAMSSYKESSYNSIKKKVSLEDNIIYVQALKRNKILISAQEFGEMVSAESALYQHKKAPELIKPNPKNKEILTEFQIEWRFDKAPFDAFRMNSILDRIIIDHSNKKILIVDLKTTSSSVENFPYSVIKYKYHRQIFLYKAAINYWIKTERPELSEYEIQTYLAVVKTGTYPKWAVYELSSEYLAQAAIEIDNLLTALHWHFENEEWEHPIYYYLNDGVVLLKPNDG